MPKPAYPTDCHILWEALINGTLGADYLPEAHKWGIEGNILEFPSVFGAREAVSMPPGRTVLGRHEMLAYPIEIG